MLKNLYIHRRYLLGSFWTDFRYRYAGTALGFYWFIVNPLLEALLYSIVFSYLIDSRSGGARGVPYVLFLLIGLFPWFAFTHIITRGSNALNSSALYLRRLAISTDIFIAREALVSMFSLFIYILILIPLNPLLGNALSWNVLVLPVLIFLFIAMGFGISLALAHVRVFFPDVGEILGVLVHLWRWTLPINYSYEIFPENIRSVLVWINPPYYFINSFRDVFLERRLPSLEAWLHMIGWVVIFGIIGSFVSSRLAAEVRDQM
jgi:ABC-type polysaccharide/polyol phosphate export permease